MDSSRSLKYFFVGFFFACFFWLSTSEAATFSAQKVMKAVPTSTGASVATQYAAKAANQSVYAVRAVQVTKASVANIVRKRSFSPWGAILTVAITAAGFVLDDLTGDISTPDAPVTDYVPGFYWHSTYYSSAASPSLASEAFGEGFSYQNGGREYTLLPIVFNSPTSITVSLTSLGSTFQTTYSRRDCSSVGTTTYCPAAAPSQSGSSATDSELFDIASNLPSHEFQRLFEDQLSGQPNSDVSEFQDVADDITQDYAYENDSDPLTIPSVDLPSGDTGTDTVSDEPPPSEDPCAKNAKLVSCLETGDLPNSSEIITQDVPYSYSSYSVLSNASCPADIPVGHGAAYSFGPVCTVASGVKPAVIAASFITGMFIIMGFGRARE